MNTEHEPDDWSDDVHVGLTDDARANLAAAIASTPANHPDKAKLEGRATKSAAPSLSEKARAEAATSTQANEPPGRANPHSKMNVNTTEAPVNAGESRGLRADLVKLYLPLWLRERIKQTAAILLDSDSDENLQRYLAEQVGSDYLVMHAAEKAQSAMVDEWTIDDKPATREAFAALRKQWTAEEDRSPLGKPKSKTEHTVAGFVETNFDLPAEVWEGVKDFSRAEGITTDSIVADALNAYFGLHRAMQMIESTTGIPAEEFSEPIRRAGLAAMAERISAGDGEGEITVPIRMAVVPTGKLPVFIDERRARFMRECGDIAGVSADSWVNEWIGTNVDGPLNGKDDVRQGGGYTFDIVDEMGDRTEEEKAALYDQLRGIAFKFQQEAKASKKGGKA